jgi:hypothetical protein
VAHEQEFRTGPKLKRTHVDLCAGWPGGMSPRLGQGLCCEAVRTQVLKLDPGGVPAWGQSSAKLGIGPGRPGQAVRARSIPTRVAPGSHQNPGRRRALTRSTRPGDLSAPAGVLVVVVVLVHWCCLPGAGGWPRCGSAMRRFVSGPVCPRARVPCTSSSSLGAQSRGADASARRVHLHSTTTLVNRGASGQRGGRGGLAAIRTGRGGGRCLFCVGDSPAPRVRPRPRPDTHVVQSRAGIFSSDRNRKVEERRRKRKRFRNKQEAVWRDPHYSTAVYSVDVYRDRHVVVAVCTAAAAAGHSTPFPIDNDKQMLHETRSGISKREMPARQILLLVKLNFACWYGISSIKCRHGLESVEDVLHD